jgi:hypothetical protein
MCFKSAKNTGAGNRRLDDQRQSRLATVAAYLYRVCVAKDKRSGQRLPPRFEADNDQRFSSPLSYQAPSHEKFNTWHILPPSTLSLSQHLLSFSFQYIFI